MNEVLNAIALRRSIRDYAPEAITDAELQALIEVAGQAPSARNLQPYHFSFVRDSGVLREFTRDARERLKDESIDVLRGAPTVCFIFSTDNGPFSRVDAGIAVGYLALAAHSLGLGSVILGMPREVFLGENREKWLKLLAAPEGSEFSVAIGIGKARSGKEAHAVREGLVTII